MYAHHNNSDQITNMYTVTQNTERYIKKSCLDQKFVFHFSPKLLSKHFSLRYMFRELQVHTETYVCLHFKGQLISPVFNQYWNVPRKFSRTR